MNIRMVAQVLGTVLCTVAALLLLPALVCLLYKESPLPFLAVTGMTALAGILLLRLKPVNKKIYAGEGFVSVGLSWVLISAFGALPFTISGEIPNYINAFFETVSGFTTTGATILLDIEGMSRGCLFWRSFTHWIGGMGVLVFIMAVLPLAGTRSIHIMRAEVPGPTVGKLVPSARKTASILYAIYVVMTLVETGLLMLGGMSLFDALIHAFGTAGTGGFSSRALSVGYYGSAYIDVVITVFMILFGVNFNLYYLLLLRKAAAVLKSEELRVYLGVILFAILTIALNILPGQASFPAALRYAGFQVASVISTTGYSTADFALWPTYSQWVLVLLMLIGACAGSTGGGIKVSRIMILCKAFRQELTKQHRPHSVSLVRLEGKPVPESTTHTTLVFFAGYLGILFLGSLVVSLDGFDVTTTFTGTLACLSNIGPGLGLVGPMGSFTAFSWLSKLTLSLCMLLGRLEIFPLLLLGVPSVWGRRA